MKKKINYESKYFSKKNIKKANQVYIVLCLLIFIFIVIIIALFAIFKDNEKIELKRTKIDELTIKNEINLYLKLKEYSILSSKIDEYIEQKPEKKLIKQLVYLKIYLILLTNNVDEIYQFIDKYKKILSKEDTNFLYGYIYYIQKNFKTSKNYLLKIQSNKILYRDSSIILAKIYLEENDYVKAINILEKIQIKDTVILYNLAYLYLVRNELKKALEYINQIKMFDNDNQIIKFKSDLLKIRIAIDDEHYDQAFNFINNIKDYPFLKDTYLYNYLIIKHYINKNKIDKVDSSKEYINIIKEINSNKGNYPYLIYQLTFLILYFENQNEIAIEFYEENKSEILKTDFEKYFILALDIYNKTGNYKKTIDSLEYNIFGSFSEKYFILAFKFFYDASIHERNYEKFIEFSENLLNSREEKLVILNLIIESYIHRGKLDEGIKYLTNNNSFTSFPPYYYLLLAKLYMAKNDVINAIKNLKIVEKMDLNEFDRDEIYLIMSQYYLKTKKLDDFKKLFSLISEKIKNKPENLILLLEYYIETANYEEAIKIAQIIIKQGKDNKEVLFYLAKSYYKIKEYEKASIYFSRLLEITSNLSEKSIFAVYLGNCNAYIGNMKSAKFYYKQAEIWDKNQSYSLINSQILEKLER